MVHRAAPNRSATAAPLLLLLAAVASHLPKADALSWPLCNSGGQVWVTEHPHTEPTFPGANLWYFCDSGINVLGVSMDPCINNGTTCTPAVYDALCQALGFDQAYRDAVTTTNATMAEAVRSLTGEYCLRKGVYSTTVPQNVASMPGKPCTKIDGLACIRQRQTIITALNQANLAAFRPAPPAAEPAVMADTTVPDAAVKAADSAPNGGRKLLSMLG